MGVILTTYTLTKSFCIIFKHKECLCKCVMHGSHLYNVLFKFQRNIYIAIDLKKKNNNKEGTTVFFLSISSMGD